MSNYTTTLLLLLLFNGNYLFGQISLENKDQSAYQALYKKAEKLLKEHYSYHGFDIKVCEDSVQLLVQKMDHLFAYFNIHAVKQYQNKNELRLKTQAVESACIYYGLKADIKNVLHEYSLLYGDIAYQRHTKGVDKKKQLKAKAVPVHTLANTTIVRSGRTQTPESTLAENNYKQKR